MWSFIRIIIPRFLILILVFLYVYPISLGFASSRNLISFFSLCFFLCALTMRKIRPIWLFPKDWTYPFIFVIFVSIFSLLTAFVNQVYEPVYVNFVFSFIGLLVSSWGISYLLKFTYGKVSMEILSFYIVLAMHIQFALSLTMFFQPSFQELIYSYIEVGDTSLNSIEATNGFRLHGVGANFFILGVINAAIILLMTAVVKQSHCKSLKIFYALSIPYFLLVGMMMARTTLLTVPFSLFCYFYGVKNIFRYVLIVTMKFLLIVGIVFLLCYGPIMSFVEENEELLRFGFEHFYNFFEGNGFSSESTSQLADMLVLPDNFSTWLIGDARITSGDGVNYYMYTDIGYSRALFYFGMLGLMAFFGAYLSMVILSSRKCKSYTVLYFCMFFLFALLFYKGMCELMFLFCLFAFVDKDFSVKKTY